MKEDIIYLAIDKLSTFIYSDIASNDRIKQLFIDAGCESLFKIDKGSFVERDDDTIAAKAEMITKYLQVDALPDYRGIKKGSYALYRTTKNMRVYLSKAGQCRRLPAAVD